jgi:carbamoyltransferase
MKYIGISCGFHDAALSVIDDNGAILFAGHSERYSGIKHDKDIHPSLIKDAMTYVGSDDYQLHYYERPLLKYLRKLRSGERPEFSSIFAKNILGKSNHELLNNKKIHTHNHHLSHAAAGFQTSTYDQATVVVIDAIGEFDTITIWHAYYDDDGRAKYKLLWRQTYPDSIGLFYSAMTDSVGLRPMDEEYILMGMAGWGSDSLVDHLSDYSISDYNNLEFNENFHAGINRLVTHNLNDYDTAACTQTITERLIRSVMTKAIDLGSSNNLVYSGGVALNCLANRFLGEYFDNIWIMPCPGDAGSSLGAAALALGNQIHWDSPYLGYDISGTYPIDQVVNTLFTTGICGIANGKAEFGPRALGNRSLLADPRGPDIKDRVNDIKQRQRFRPFAPVILEEYASQYFDLPEGFDRSPYMQTVATCLAPELYPAIIHIDGTSRVQTVSKDCKSGIRQLLEAWHAKTGCPMLLNTSLNIRGEPMVNDRVDADRFEYLYNIPVFS